MRVVIALGGNALLRRSEPMSAEVQRHNVRIAAEAIAPLAGEHEVVMAHGNGPQVGLLALQAEAYHDVEPYPLDVLGAESQGMIGYLVEQELRNALGPEAPLVTILTMIEVDPDDPAFGHPTKFVGPVYDEATAQRLSNEKHWSVARDGSGWRRVVPSPQPRRIVEIEPIRWLLERHGMVICAGGGGVPVVRDTARGGALVGVEGVIDKDLASALLAEEIAAELLVMATDVDGVYVNWGEPGARRLDVVAPAELGALDFAAGSMGPKAQAAVRFASRPGRRAAIGRLEDLGAIVQGTAGTQVVAGPVPAPAPFAEVSQ